MTSLREILGSNAVSRSSAENLGTVEGAVVDADVRAITAWQIGKGRRARFVDHAHLSGIGAAAVIVDSEASLRESSTVQEKAMLKHHRVLLGSYLLSDSGDSLGEVADAEVDTDTGALVSVSSGTEQFASDRLRGFGSFALVVGLQP